MSTAADLKKNEITDQIVEIDHLVAFWVSKKHIMALKASIFKMWNRLLKVTEDNRVLETILITWRGDPSFPFIVWAVSAQSTSSKNLCPM